nr:general stress protein [Leifsonia sp. Leaf325]
MSNQNPFAGRRPAASPVLPRGEIVATYDTYAEAQNAVAVLARADFPVKSLSIVGNDLKTVENVTGRMTYARAALAGAASGAWLGVFFGLLMFIFVATGVNLALVVAAVLIGAGFGMLFGIVTYSVNRRRRDFTSTMQVIASNYQVIVDGELVNRARNVLSGAADAAATEAVVEADPEPVFGDPVPVDPGVDEPRPT